MTFAHRRTRPDGHQRFLPRAGDVPGRLPCGAIHRDDFRRLPRLRAGEPDRAAAFAGRRLPNVLRAESTSVSAARGERGAGAPRARPGRRPADGPAPLPRRRARDAGGRTPRTCGRIGDPISPPSFSAAASASRRDCWRPAYGFGTRKRTASYRMYVTDRDCEPAGPFRGRLVVSMRPIPPHRGSTTPSGSATSSRSPTAPRCTSATRRRSGSAISPAPDWGEDGGLRPGGGAGLLGVRRDLAGRGRETPSQRS